MNMKRTLILMISMFMMILPIGWSTGEFLGNTTKLTMGALGAQGIAHIDGKTYIIDSGTNISTVHEYIRELPTDRSFDVSDGGSFVQVLIANNDTNTLIVGSQFGGGHFVEYNLSDATFGNQTGRNSTPGDIGIAQQDATYNGEFYYIISSDAAEEIYPENLTGTGNSFDLTSIVEGLNSIAYNFINQTYFVSDPFATPQRIYEVNATFNNTFRINVSISTDTDTGIQMSFNGSELIIIDSSLIGEKVDRYDTEINFLGGFESLHGAAEARDFGYDFIDPDTGETLFVLCDRTHDNIYFYNLTSIKPFFLDISAQSGDCRSAASNGSHIFVVEATADILITYTKTSYVSNISIVTDAPRGLFINGTDKDEFWIVDNGETAAFLYNSTGYTGINKSYEATYGLSGLTYLGGKWWVVDAITDTIIRLDSEFQYDNFNFSVDLNIAVGAFGMAHADGNFYVHSTGIDADRKFLATYNGTVFNSDAPSIDAISLSDTTPLTTDTLQINLSVSDDNLSRCDLSDNSTGVFVNIANITIPVLTTETICIFNITPSEGFIQLRVNVSDHQGNVLETSATNTSLQYTGSAPSVPPTAAAVLETGESFANAGSIAITIGIFIGLLASIGVAMGIRRKKK